ncbi:peptidyl-prolyl cis-trans isomerase [bacterium]|nr:peptidyl-prolyl cis-trans isomerase [bacterium]
MTVLRAITLAVAAAIVLGVFCLIPAMLPDPKSLRRHETTGAPVVADATAAGASAAPQPRPTPLPRPTPVVFSATPDSAPGGYATLAVYDATTPITSADLVEDPSLLDILEDRALTREDAREAMRRLVYFRKFRAQAYEEYSKPTFRAQVKADRARLERIANLILEREIDPAVPEIAEASIEEHFAAHAGEFVRPAAFRFQHMIRLSGNAPLEAEAKMREAHARLSEGVPFQRIAEEYGQPTDNPGEIAEESVRVLSQAAPRLVRELESLSPGQLSQPFQTESGWAVVKLIEKIPQRPLTLEESRSRIVAELRAPYRQALLDQLLQELEKKYAVKRYFDRVSEDMRMGYNMVLFTIDGRDYDWRSVQQLYLFSDTDTTLRMSRRTSALPLIEQQVVWRMLEQYARENGYMQDPSVQAVYQNTIDSTLIDSSAEMKKTRRMLADYKPSEEELRQYYVLHKRDKYMKPPTLELQFLYIPYEITADKGEKAEEARKRSARERMAEVESRLAKGDSFSALVAQYSQHPSKANNGLLSISDALVMFDRVKIEQYLDRPHVNYPPFEWNEGLAKVHILSASRGEPFSFEEVRSQIEKLDLYEETEARVRRDIRDQIIRDAGLVWNDAAIAAFVRDMNRRHRSQAD